MVIQQKSMKTKRIAAKNESRAGEARSTDESSRLRVLVAEDDPTTQLLICEALEQAGFVVDLASDGNEALGLLRNVRPNIVVTDVMMPECDGLLLLATLRARPEYDHLPVLVVTGLDDHASISQAFAAGATDFITKPINYSLLTRRLRYVLRLTESIKRLAESERRLAMAQRIARLGHWDMEPGTDRLRISGEVCRILGLAQQPDFPSFSMLVDGVHEADRTRVRTWLAELRRGVPQSDIIYRIVVGEGEERWIRQQVEIDPAAGERRLSLHGILQDITSLRLAHPTIS